MSRHPCETTALSLQHASPSQGLSHSITRPRVLGRDYYIVKSYLFVHFSSAQILESSKHYLRYLRHSLLVLLIPDDKKNFEDMGGKISFDHVRHHMSLFSGFSVHDFENVSFAHSRLESDIRVIEKRLVLRGMHDVDRPLAIVDPKSFWTSLAEQPDTFLHIAVISGCHGDCSESGLFAPNFFRATLGLRIESHFHTFGNFLSGPEANLFPSRQAISSGNIDRALHKRFDQELMRYSEQGDSKSFAIHLAVGYQIDADAVPESSL